MLVGQDCQQHLQLPLDALLPPRTCAEPHIGHLHSLVLADVFKRFSDFKSDTSAPKAMLLTGTDEHGMKIQKAAESKGVTPRELCDTVSKRFEVRDHALEITIHS